MLHTRLNRIAADAVALDGCVTYIEQEIRPALEARPGSLGISVLWRDARARAAAPSVAAILRTEAPDEVASAVEDYALVFSTVLEP